MFVVFYASLIFLGSVFAYIAFSLISTWWHRFISFKWEEVQVLNQIAELPMQPRLYYSLRSAALVVSRKKFSTRKLKCIGTSTAFHAGPCEEPEVGPQSYFCSGKRYYVVIDNFVELIPHNISEEDHNRTDGYSIEKYLNDMPREKLQHIRYVVEESWNGVGSERFEIKTNVKFTFFYDFQRFMTKLHSGSSTVNSKAAA